MFSNGFPKEWSTLRKLTWLYRTVINAVSAVLKTIIGNPIHITDALAKPVQALSIALEPVQDLHGYDAPWPAGGGKNKFAVGDAVGVVPATGAAYGLTVTCHGDNETITITGTPSWTAAGGKSFRIISTREGSYYGDAPVTHNYDGMNAKYFVVSKSSNISEVNEVGLINSDGTIGISLKNTDTADISLTLKLFIYEGATAPTAWAPYSNICPITGHTDADVVRTGANIGIVKNLYVGGGSGLAVGNDGILVCFNCIKGQTYRIGNSSGNRNGLFKFRGVMDDIKSGASMSEKVLESNLPLTFTADETCIYCYYRNNTWSDTIANSIMVSLGSSVPSDYSPYVGTTYPIPLGQTVYGGTVDTVAGVLTVEWVFYEYDGDEDWISGANYFGLFNQQSSVGNNDLTQIANWLKGAGNGYAKYGGFCAQSNGAIVVGKTGGPWADTNAFKATLAQTPLQICYKLATPTTIQLTPQQVELLQGENNLWSDGTITMTYLADGNASDVEALNILLGGRYVNNHTEDEPTDREALDILLGRTR